MPQFRCYEKNINRLKAAAVTSLLSILECVDTPYIPERLLAALDTDALIKNMNHLLCFYDPGLAIERSHRAKTQDRKGMTDATHTHTNTSLASGVFGRFELKDPANVMAPFGGASEMFTRRVSVSGVDDEVSSVRVGARKCVRSLDGTCLRCDSVCRRSSCNAEQDNVLCCHSSERPGVWWV